LDLSAAGSKAIHDRAEPEGLDVGEGDDDQRGLLVG